MVNTSKQKMAKRPDARLTKAISRLGFNVSDLSSNDFWSGNNGKHKAMEVSCASWLKFSDDFFNKSGSLIYLAVSGKSDLEVIIKQWERLNG